VLKETYISTIEYLESKKKAERKKIGQFFTSKPAAEFMGGLFNCKSDTVRVADPGAGTGILASAVLDHLFELKYVKTIVLDLYENDENVLPILEQNMILWNRIAKREGVVLNLTLIKENFIKYNQLNWHNGFYQGEYDFIISNPPYKKISKTDIEAKIMDEVVYGQPNLYFMFMAMACKLLKENGEMVFIVPKSWTSGLYFKAFREYLLSNMRIERIHQFVSRKRVFENEDVLQETIIMKTKKTQAEFDQIIISSSESIDDFTKPNSLYASYDLCVRGDGNRFVFLPISDEEIEILFLMESFEDTLISLGFRMKTGPTVDFRVIDEIQNDPATNNLPLLWAQNISA
jgi:adenine-specific DNA-methyltransferase